MVRVAIELDESASALRQAPSLNPIPSILSVSQEKILDLLSMLDLANDEIPALGLAAVAHFSGCPEVELLRGVVVINGGYRIGVPYLRVEGLPIGLEGDLSYPLIVQARLRHLKRDPSTSYRWVKDEPSSSTPSHWPVEQKVRILSLIQRLEAISSVQSLTAGTAPASAVSAPGPRL